MSGSGIGVFFKILSIEFITLSSRILTYSADLILNFNKFLTKFHPVPFIEISMNEGGGDKTKNSSLLS